MTSETEESLDGGQINRVVRIADTVRRPAGPWTTSIHELLVHLEASGFEASPRALGIDEQGREILSFIPGDAVGTMPWPSWVWSEETLLEVGSLLARYHQSIQSFVPSAPPAWRLTQAPLRPGEVICHNDVAPYNLVRRPGGELTLIDWDMASPGIPELDLAFAACAFVPMNDDAESQRRGWARLPDRPRRLRLLVDAYGLSRSKRPDFVDLMAERLQISIDRISGAARAGDPAFQAMIDHGILEPVKRSLELIEQQHREFQDALEEA